MLGVANRRGAGRIASSILYNKHSWILFFFILFNKVGKTHQLFISVSKPVARLDEWCILITRNLESADFLICAQQLLQIINTCFRLIRRFLTWVPLLICRPRLCKWFKYAWLVEAHALGEEADGRHWLCDAIRISLEIRHVIFDLENVRMALHVIESRTV